MSISHESLFGATSGEDSETALVNTLTFIDCLSDEFLLHVIEVVELNDDQHEELKERFKSLAFRLEDVK